MGELGLNEFKNREVKMNKTYIGLVMEFESNEIKLSDCCEKYFGLSYRQASTRARHQELPVPCYRAGSQRSEWLIDGNVFAGWIDEKKKEAMEDHRRMNGG